MPTANANGANYCVVFAGHIKQGVDRRIVKKKLIKLFNNKAEMVERLFKKEKTILRKNLSKQQAIKFKSVFETSGALCTIKVIKARKKVRAPAKKQPRRTQAETRQSSTGKTPKTGSFAIIKTLDENVKNMLWTVVIAVILAVGFWFTPLSEMVVDNITDSESKPGSTKTIPALTTTLPGKATKPKSRQNASKAKAVTTRIIPVITGYLLF